MDKIVVPAQQGALAKTPFRLKWEAAPPRGKVLACVVSAGFVVAGFTWASSQFFQIRGVQHMLTSRIFLALTILFALLGAWGVAWVFFYSKRYIIISAAGVLLIVAGVALDRAFPMPKSTATDKLHSSGDDEAVTWITGGDSYCYFMLYWFDLQADIAKNVVIIKIGKFPLYNVRMRLVDLDTGQEEAERYIGEISGTAGKTQTAISLNGAWKLRPSAYYRVIFTARNGVWHQDLQLKKSVKAQCWLAATRVINSSGNKVFEQIDNEYVGEFGNPAWRP